ncbi:transcription termination/antitermination protein NusG [Patescibacteria group bacterium]|nr:transcription termination/antitermination protein NusG [Patescibacteria group bacterium]MBU1931808.1 transcription termination/antitermination protein NusG [Patescibacteria group bacterium]
MTKKNSKTNKKPATLNTQKKLKALKDKKSQLLEPKSNENHVVISETVSKKAKWYVVHTYSGHELKVTQALKQRVETMNLGDKIFEILTPTQNKIQIRQGAKQKIREKIFPGYLLIKMILTDESWLAIRTTQGITSFVGANKKPIALQEKEVTNILNFMQVEAPKYKNAFSLGEAVKIIEGPFADFLGTVDYINDEKGKVQVLVSIFGRETPVELDFLQVQKI